MLCVQRGWVTVEQFDIYHAFPAMIGQGTCWSVTTWTVIVCGCKGWRGLALDAAWRDAAFSGNPSPSFFFHSSFVCVACRAAVRWRWSHKHGIWPTDYSGTQWMAGEDQAPAKAFFLYYLHTHTQKKCSSLTSTQPLRENYPLYEKPVGWISPDSLHLSSSRMLNNHKPWTKTTTRR